MHHLRRLLDKNLLEFNEYLLSFELLAKFFAFMLMLMYID